MDWLLWPELLRRAVAWDKQSAIAMDTRFGGGYSYDSYY